jgi:hypothetical protein
VFAYLESAVTPSTKHEAGTHYYEIELHIHANPQFCAKAYGRISLGDPKSREQTFVDLFVEDFVADETMHDAVVDLAQECSRISESELHLPF